MNRSDILEGMRVIISEHSQFHYQFRASRHANSTTGTVCFMQGYYPADLDAKWIQVDFDNGYSNCYRAEDLVLVDATHFHIKEASTICPQCNTEMDCLDSAEQIYECPSCLLIDMAEGSLYNAAI